MQQKYPHDDCEEATQSPNNISSRHILPLFKKNSWTSQNWSCKEHVIYWRHNGSVENVQSPVEIINLCAHTDHKAEQEDPGQGVLQNRFAGQQLFDGDAQTLHTGDWKCSNHRADCNIHKNVCLSMSRSHHEDEYQGHNDHKCCKDHKT